MAKQHRKRRMEINSIRGLMDIVSRYLDLRSKGEIIEEIIKRKYITVKLTSGDSISFSLIPELRKVLLKG